MLAAGGEIGVVLHPILYGVALERAGAGEYGLPQGLDRAALRQGGEDLLRPLHAGHGGDAPLLAVLARVYEGLEHGVARAHALGVLRLVHPGEAVRVVAYDVYAGGEGVRLPALLGYLPVLHLAEALHALVPDVQLCQRLVAPFDLHLGRAGLVGLVHHHLHELGLVEPGVDHHALPLLHIGARADYEPCVIPEYCLFHFYHRYLKLI